MEIRIVQHIASHRIALHLIASHRIARHHITPHYTTPHHTTPHHTTPHHTTPHHATPHHTTPHNTPYNTIQYHTTVALNQHSSHSPGDLFEEPHRLLAESPVREGSKGLCHTLVCRNLVVVPQLMGIAAVCPRSTLPPAEKTGKKQNTNDTCFCRIHVLFCYCYWCGCVFFLLFLSFILVSVLVRVYLQVQLSSLSYFCFNPVC